MTKEEQLKAIVDEIFALKSPKIDASKKAQIFEFIKTTVNGDELETRLIIEVTLDKKPGIFVYILTNLRLIQFEIDTSGKIQSMSFILNKIAGVERKLIEDGDRIEVSVRFNPDTLVGLKYKASSKTINEFFQKVEQSWIQRSLT